MSLDLQIKKGLPSQYKDDRDGAVLFPHPVIGVVKNNIDPSNNGMIDVYIERGGGIDPDDSKYWTKRVKYMSPFFGSNIPAPSVEQKKTKTDKTFTSNPHSYGMWAGVPEIGTQVICIFINGRPDAGYYIGAVVPIGNHAMVPALGSFNNVVPNKAEASSLGGASRLPTTDPNINDEAVRNSSSIKTEPRTIHSYQAAILKNQGLTRDNIRGTIGSSSMRQTNGTMIGMSTSGRKILSGGANDKTINDATKNQDSSKLKPVSYLGGHSFVMDDGTQDGKDQLIRLRTGGGHQILMSDSGQSVFIIHSNGHSWVELGKEGTVDIYAANSFNVRTIGDINFHADRDINIHANRNLTMHGTSVKVDSDKSTTFYSGQDFSVQNFGKYSVNSTGIVSMKSESISNYASTGPLFVTGKPILLNTGFGPGPETVTKIQFNKHKDAVYSQKVGWCQPGPTPIVSCASRTPTHQPWDGAGKGVDVKINQCASSSEAQSTSPCAQANGACDPVPQNPTSPEAVNTVPPQSAVSVGGKEIVDAPTVRAMVSQQSASNAGLSKEQKAVCGIIPGPAGLTVQQLESAGVCKPGTAEFISAKMKAGQSFVQAAGNNLMTGIEGARTAADLVKAPLAQVSAVAKSFDKAATDLISKGVIAKDKITEAVTQPAGIIAATAQAGLSAVTNALKTPATIMNNFVGTATEKIKSIGDMISGGNFASALGTLTSGVGGVAASLGGIVAGGVSGIVSGVLGGVTGALGGLFGGSKAALGVAAITAKFQSVYKQAFTVVENSFTKLTPGVANNLGGAISVNDKTESQKQLATLLTAKQERLDAEENLRTAKRLARLGGPTSDMSEVTFAENTVAAARQKEAKLASSVVIGTDDSNSTLNSADKSGINSMPGGSAAFVAQVNNSGPDNNIISGLKLATKSITDNTG